MKKRVLESYPDLNIVGMYSPPFRDLTKDENEEIVRMINDAKPDFVWIGLGAPKQEIWMARHKGIIEGVMIGVGAGFDYYAGNIKRAPWLMQVLYLEWLYRLMQDPRRLWKRYVTTNVKFVQLIITQQRRLNVKQYVK
jgi:N-acetylglucosaminyldiphosphoundecaprenol N-acetyl-beta-D-mannosaminyltransferase